MKKNITTRTQALLAFALGMHITPAYSCPTCVGRLTAQSPAFFAQDYANPQPTNTTSSSQSSASFLFNQQRKTAASVPFEFESDTSDSTDTGSSQPQQPLPTKK